ncbi:8-oxo-dGTP pyrophosphatase MutT (NUDIX family) [Arthrobacter pascens]|uniref:NUDIX domain-containing protein n=1 Tax=Arthrobacter pascens TaxID=1677 RepID=UPI002785EAFA|nr:NUDIX hydrolase [Arthrobacter pascens]MDQ0634586.1 8-oxo-dGTP pyrophosphatase MutT (NUDIX family) [Arthrobacter pascens]
MPGIPETPHAARQVSDTPSPRRLLSTEKVYEGRIWDVVSDSFQLQDTGDALTRDYIEHPGAVAVLPMNDAGEILLLKQYRHPVGMDLWEIPAGLLDVEGEDFVAGAARELAEEADLAAGTWNVLADFFNSPGSSSEAIRIYLARDIAYVPHHERHERMDEEAEIEFHWIALDDAVDAVLEGRLHNPSAVVGILAAAAARTRGYADLRPADAPWPAHPSQR